MLQTKTKRELERKYAILRDFIKNSITYPWRTIKENRSEYKIATAILIACLAFISIFLLGIFYRHVFAPYVFSWKGKVVSMEDGTMVGGKTVQFYNLKVTPEGTDDIRDFPVPASFYKNVSRGATVIKPSFYNTIIPENGSRDGGELFKDALLFTFGVLLLLFGLVASNGFFALIYASLFMVEPKYSKKPKKKK